MRHEQRRRDGVSVHEACVRAYNSISYKQDGTAHSMEDEERRWTTPKFGQITAVENACVRLRLSCRALLQQTWTCPGAGQKSLVVHQTQHSDGHREIDKSHDPKSVGHLGERNALGAQWVLRDVGEGSGQAAAEVVKLESRVDQCGVGS